VSGGASSVDGASSATPDTRLATISAGSVALALAQITCSTPGGSIHDSPAWNVRAGPSPSFERTAPESTYTTTVPS
jgi:hypothetical protein